MNEVVKAKVRQAADLLREFDVPLWIVQFARETNDNRQPIGDLAVGASVTWPAAFVVSASGESTAIVGTGDLDNVRAVGAYDRVIGYVKDVGPPLLDLLAAEKPDRIAVSYSEGDEGADNITYGMFLMLQHLLNGTEWATRLMSAETILVSLRARKLPLEVDRIRGAVGVTLDLFQEIERMFRVGMTESELHFAVRRSIDRAGITTAWDERYDPVVNFGPDSAFGHAPPGTIRLEHGMVAHVDLGVKQHGYCSDLQRSWYVLRPGETNPPEDVQRAFEAVRKSLQVGYAALRPGVPGYAVDAAARQILIDAGYEEPQFSLGHQLGQSAHDAGALLGPRWPRYGQRPEMLVEEGNVFSLEFALKTSAGTIGVEEDVLVTSSGAEYLTPPQTELNCLPL
jgi:Xaa-Pro aminopeptidase